MKVVFKNKPFNPLKTKTLVWDSNTVMAFLESWYPYEVINLRELSLKFSMLLVLLSGQWVQTIHVLHINDIELVDIKFAFCISKLFEHSRKGVHRQPKESASFPHSLSLCIITCIREYVAMTTEIRERTGESKFLLSFQKPNKAVSKVTLSRWIQKPNKAVSKVILSRWIKKPNKAVSKVTPSRWIQKPNKAVSKVTLSRWIQKPNKAVSKVTLSRWIQKVLQ